VEDGRVRAAIYVRISKDRAGSGLGVARQEEDCRALVASAGWEVGEVFVDNDLSAYSGRERPAYRRMLDAVAAGGFGAVVAWHPDRLHRSPTELEAFIDVVESSGVAVATVRAGALDLGSAAGRMTARVVGAVARHESEQKSERHRAKTAQLAAAGLPSGGGRRPFGFEADGVTVRESEATVIREVAGRLLSGESLRGVVEWLAVEGVVTPAGGLWRRASLRKLMLSPRIAGRRQHRGEDVGPAVWPAIVDEVSWRRLGRLLRANGRPAPGRKYLLSGLVFCGACGQRLVAHPSHGRRQLSCVRGAETGGCGRVHQAVEPLDEAVVAAVVERHRSPSVREGLAAVDVDAGPVEARLVEVEARRDALLELLGVGDLSPAEWQRMRPGIDAELAELRAALPVPVPPVGADVDLAERWSSLHLDVQRRLVESVVVRVVVAPCGSRGGRFDPGRVEIVWR
jgi:DNA invertase Pin-like site-specific DNA recombinase